MLAFLDLPLPFLDQDNGRQSLAHATGTRSEHEARTGRVRSEHDTSTKRLTFKTRSDTSIDPFLSCIEYGSSHDPIDASTVVDQR